MTVESTKTKEIYKGNGATTVFPVPYQYSKTDTVLLVFTDAGGKDSLITSNYRIDVNSSGNTTVVYPVTGTPIPAGTKLTVYRNTPLTQIVDLIYGGAFNPEVLEGDGFDRIVMMIQELQEEVDRAVKVSISDENPPKSAEEFYADMQGFADAAAESAADSEASAQRSEAAADKAEKVVADGLVQIDESVSLARKWATNPEDEPVQDNEFSAYHWAKKAQQVLSAAGYVDYTIGAVDPSGRVRINYAAIGHPAMDRLTNPIINILSRNCYTHTIAARSILGFEVIIYRPDGTPGVDVGEYVDCGSFECGDGTQCGEQGHPVVFLIVSIPVP